jgi:hypothetical protein
MKKIFTHLFVMAFLLTGYISFGQSNSITIGISGNACDELIVEWISTYDFTQTSSDSLWTQATLTITWPSTLGSSALGTITSLLPGFTGWQYNGDAVLDNGTYQREVILINGAYNEGIPTGTTEVIAITLNGTGTGDFTIDDPNGTTNISHGVYGTEIWTGSFATPTTVTLNLDDKIVWNGSEWCGGSGTNNQPGAGDTKDCFITGTAGQITDWGATVGSLTIQTGADLTIVPSASLTNNGATTINQSQGLVIGADSTGSGSFIDNGTISYGGSGSAKVQTYVKNNSTPGSYYIHQIGPAVNDPTFPTSYPGESGVFLGAFNLQTLGTYSYRYTEPSNSWENIYLVTTPVPRGSGKLITTTDSTNYVLDMIGALTTAPSFISTTTSSDPDLVPWTVTLTPTEGNGLYLGSNPFPSGLDLKAWRSYMVGNGAGIGNSLYVWDQSASTYSVATSGFSGWTYTGVLGSTSAVINPGQGFFTQFTNLNVNFLAFNNSLRVHLHAPFIKDFEDDEFPALRLALTKEYSKDEVVIKFADGATSAYDDYCDGLKWMSMIEEASELMTLSADNVKLTIDFLPELGNELVTVPLEMKPGTNGEHIIDATEIINFESGSQIYLEDLQTGGEWIDLIDNPTYIFSSFVDDPLHRFNLHFFGPTGIEDPVADEQLIHIYSYDHDAYIVNRGNEVIEEFVVYDMTGRELQRGTLPVSTVNKVYIGQVSGYYVVKVITNNRIYADKVFINR